MVLKIYVLALRSFIPPVVLHQAYNLSFDSFLFCFRFFFFFFFSFFSLGEFPWDSSVDLMTV